MAEIAKIHSDIQQALVDAIVYATENYLVRDDFLASLVLGLNTIKTTLKNIESQDFFQAKKNFDVLSMKVKDSLYHFLCGDTVFAYRSMSLWWHYKEESTGKNVEKKDVDIIGLYGKVFELSENETMYRMRVGSVADNYSHHDMFCVPFSERRKIKNERYSVSGYPCLYAGMSPYVCWEELRRPNLTDVYTTKIRLNNGNKKYLLDLRVFTIVHNINELCHYISMLPLILACSVPVPNAYDNMPFKLEYVFPQFLMNAITKGKFVRSQKIDGVIYTSTRCKGGLRKCSSPENDCIAILVPSEKEELVFRSSFEAKTPVVLAYSNKSLNSINDKLNEISHLLDDSNNIYKKL